eukprot:46898_1
MNHVLMGSHLQILRMGYHNHSKCNSFSNNYQTNNFKICTNYINPSLKLKTVSVSVSTSIKYKKKSKKKYIKSTICPGSKRQIQLCSFLIRGGKRITPIRFCGYASPKLHKLPVCLRLDNMPTRHAEIGAINALTYKSRQLRLLKKTTLVVIRFIKPPPRQKWSSKKCKKRYKSRQKHMGVMELDDEKHILNENNNDFELNLACSRPCSECIKIIRALRIKSVIYVNDENNLVNESPDCIESTVHSGGTLGIIEKRIT